MRTDLKQFIEKLTSAAQLTNDQQRRGRLLTQLIIITAAFNLFLLLANLWLWLSQDSAMDRVYFFVGLVGCIVVFGVWVINRLGFELIAAVLTLLLYLGRISLVTEPERFINAYWAFLIPILISSFIIRPICSIPTAGASAILYVLLSTLNGGLEALDIVIFKLFLLFLLAALTYFITSHLERSFETVNQSEAKFRHLFNNLPIGLYRTSPEGKILDANPAFLEMFGFPDLPTLQQVNARDLYANPNHRAENLSSAEANTSAEMQMRKSNGICFWVTDHVRPIPDSKGNIVYYEGSLIDISERKKAEQDLQLLATTDPLTGLPNRRYFFSQAEQVFARPNRPSSAYAILMIDIDHFKKINDDHGHATGDIVLHEVAQRIHANLRVNDISGRYGGEEFSILLMRISEEETRQITDRLCTNLAREPVKVGKEEIRITVSIGVAILNDSSSSLDDLLQRADQALYAAKQAGRNCWRLWNPSLLVSL